MVKCVLVILAALVSVAVGQNRLDIHCQGVTGGKFVANPESRCSGWLQCNNNAVIRTGNCAEPYVFVQAKGGCTYATGECADFWTKLDVQCVKGDFYDVPHPRNCNQYVFCVNGDPHIVDCAPDTEFSKAAGGCIPASESTCVPNRCPAVDGEDLVILNHPRNCALYFYCFGGKQWERSCASGMVFDKVISQCNIPANTDQSHCTPATGGETEGTEETGTGETGGTDETGTGETGETDETGVEDGETDGN